MTLCIIDPEQKENGVVVIEPNRLADHNITEYDICKCIATTPQLIMQDDSNFLLIDKEFSPWENSQRRIDLFGIDSEANLIVVEAKRDENCSHQDLQALRYAAMLQNFCFADLVKFYAKHLNINNEKGDNFLKTAEGKLISFLQPEIMQMINEDPFKPLNTLIYLVSTGFSNEIITTCEWLSEKAGMNIFCIKIDPYKVGDKLALRPECIIPRKPASTPLLFSDYKSLDRANLSKRNMQKFSLGSDGPFSKGKFVWNLVKKYIDTKKKQNISITYDALKEIFPDTLQGSFGVFKTKIDANAHEEKSGYKRYYTNESDIIELQSEQDEQKRQIVVCNQWGFGRDGINMINILDKANKLFTTLGEDFRVS